MCVGLVSAGETALGRKPALERAPLNTRRPFSFISQELDSILSETNRFGLSRRIPDAIAREVRQRSRFGCVRCRSAIYTYEHIDPQFADAVHHDASRICLLCPKCHLLVTKKRVPKESIRKAYDDIQCSAAPLPPLDDEFFLAYQPNTTVHLGSCKYEGIETIIKINGDSVLSYSPRSSDPPYVVNARFRDEKGGELFQVVDNEWIGPVDVYDVEQVGARLSISRVADYPVFIGEKDIGTNSMRLIALDMVVPPFHVFVTKDALAVGRLNDANTFGLYLVMALWRISGGHTAISLDSLSASTFANATMRLGTGELGTTIGGSGITIGAGAETVALGWFGILRESADLGATASASFRRRMRNGSSAMRNLVGDRTP